MSDRAQYVYVRVNMQHREVIDVFVRNVVHGLLFDKPAEQAMIHFGPLEADEEVFTIVNPDFTHNFHKRKLEIN